MNSDFDRRAMLINQSSPLITLALNKQNVLLQALDSGNLKDLKAALQGFLKAGQSLELELKVFKVYNTVLFGIANDPAAGLVF